SVSKIDWLNPHVHIFMEVEDGGTISSWAVELESTVDLRRSGWTADTLKAGDVITVQGMAARDSSRQVWGESVVVAGTGQRVFAVTPAVPPVYDNGPTPRWPDGHPRLGAPVGQSGGYWDFPSKSSLIEDGVNAPMDSF